jgi:hypothetical protein
MHFTEVQKNFTDNIRNPEKNPAPDDVEARRMEIYQGLFYRNVESFMAKSFRVLRKLIDDDKWHAMIRDYFMTHQSRTPLFPKMPQEFLHYLQDERPAEEDDLPFMLELAQYEWVEIDLSIDTREISMDSIDPDGDFLTGIPVLNEIIMPMAFQWPVHRIRPDNIPTVCPDTPTYLLVYRNKKDKVRFFEMNPVSARMIEILKQAENKTGKQVLEQIADELGHPQPDVVINGGLEVFDKMRDKDIILGTRA